MRAQLNKIAEVASEFVKLGIQMGMPTGLNYFSKKKDWLDGIIVCYINPPYTASSKSSFDSSPSFSYKDINVSRSKIEIPLDITDEELERIIQELETELEYLQTSEGLLELKQVVDEAWNEKRWL